MIENFNISGSIQNIVDSIPFLAPEFILVAGFLVVIVLDLFVKRSEKLVFFISLLTFILGICFSIAQFARVGSDGIALFADMLVLTKKGILFKILILIGAVFSAVFFNNDKRILGHAKGVNDFFSVFIATILAMLILVTSANLLIVFIAIEMLSLGSYIMVSYTAEKSQQMEAGMKYMLFGVTSSAIMLYGISFIYGFSGSLNLLDGSVFNGLNEVPPIAKNLIIIFFVVGIGFKLSAAPFHFWTPDVYQAAPTSVTSFLSTVPKVAVFGWLYSINNQFHLVGEIYLQVIFALAILSLLAGNVLAVFQNDLKRLLAYSAIGHTGFMLMIFVLPETDVFHSLFFYLLVYIVTNIGAFLVLYHYEEKYDALSLQSIKGLGKATVLASTVLIIFLVSLIGLPPTGGFIAKFILFSELINQPQIAPYGTWLLIVAVITTVISLFYYFKIPLNLFLREGEEQSINWYNRKLVFLPVAFAILIILLGIFPSVVKFF
ncbi:proton-translocating NADH-quinone oxidoreductase, chain N [Pseudopedobacter saltans DSM 12145]|uniref:NADH-quinone oxidoreductase subunit N n=1 Tax=Pseudopedobacter saltans (strain ATCC 51119 / DSM 12145 / JCM 21818 / CCUG 39354 / LMG 10337 / NBRC 100064 / NCIMB 13643) TaxID=762903 RepID=F0S9E6_PSESL|nr:NADH-quinone oxidoreductase subunit N [Pseudopedobacter saltans]ADY52496.1 proton-translocating NADH-quinone oxidoreductase, chain N [Pseudopedobacter saltans DSM 12145]